MKATTIAGRLLATLALGSLCATALAPQSASAQVFLGVSVTVAPPELPYYTQPEPPGPGYVWTPGFWAWGDNGYYWVPGTWMQPPQPGYYWTPGYWSYDDGSYLFNPGYWAQSVGFYGNVDYGYGYYGTVY